MNVNDPDHVFYFDVTADNGDSGYFDVMETHDNNAFLNGNDGLCGQMRCFWQGAYVTFLMHREDEETPCTVPDGYHILRWPHHHDMLGPWRLQLSVHSSRGPIMPSYSGERRLRIRFELSVIESDVLA